MADNQLNHIVEPTNRTNNNRTNNNSTNNNSTNNTNDDQSDESLLPYNPSLLGNGQGFVNLGATCYFNSLLQCLLSCTSIYEVLKKNQYCEHIKTNSLAQELLHLYQAAENNENIHQRCIPIWRIIYQIARKRQDNCLINMGQQDAHEGLMLFLDIMDTIPEIKRLFEHRHRIKILCTRCQQWVVNRYETNMTFEVQPTLTTEQHKNFKSIDQYYNTAMPLNEFLRKQNGYVDENFKCPNSNCQDRQPKFKITSLVMIPEILPILLKKYQQKIMTPFPSTLEFIASSQRQKYIYKLIAQSEHSGNMHGGHYWAISLRRDGWKQLNDMLVTDGQPGPTINSYIVFYHYTHTENI